MDRKVWNMCGKKKRYRDEHSANQYRKKAEAERGKSFDYYWCPYCKGFHLTSEEFIPERAGEKLALVYAQYA